MVTFRSKILYLQKNRVTFIATTMSCFGQPCFPIIRQVGGISLYKADAGTDIYSAIQYLSEGHIWWGSLTIFFTVLPTVLAALLICVFLILDGKYRRALLAILCFPLAPLGSLYWTLYHTVKGNRPKPTDNSNDNNSNSSSEEPDHLVAVSMVKFSDSLTESLPQASIAMHIIFQTLHIGEAVATYQWVTLTVSLVALSFSLATNDSFGDKSALYKFSIFLISLPAITSRLMVCCTYSSVHPAYWLIPSCTELAIWIIIWIIKKCSDHKLWKWKSVIVVSSSLYVWYAIGGLFVGLPQAVTITSLVMNIIMALLQIMLWSGWWRLLHIPGCESENRDVENGSAENNDTANSLVDNNDT